MFIKLNEVHRVSLPNSRVMSNLLAFVQASIDSLLISRNHNQCFIAWGVPSISEDELNMLLPMCDMSLSNDITYLDVPVTLWGYKAPAKMPLVDGRVIRLFPDFGRAHAEFKLRVTHTEPVFTADVTFHAIYKVPGDVMPVLGASVDVLIETLSYKAEHRAILVSGHVLEPARGPIGLLDMTAANKEMLDDVRHLYGELQKRLAEGDGSAGFASRCRIYSDKAWISLEKAQVHRTIDAQPFDLVSTKWTSKAKQLYYVDLHNFKNILVYRWDVLPGAKTSTAHEERSVETDTNALLIAVQNNLTSLLALH